MPVAEAAAASSVAAGATSGGAAAGGSAAGAEMAGGGAATSGSISGGSAAGSAASGAGGATIGGTAAQNGGMGAAAGNQINSKMAQAYSRARNTSKGLRLDRVSFNKKNEKEDNDTLLKSNPILTIGVVIILIICMLVSFILSGPLSMTYPLFMGIQGVTDTVSSKWNINESSTNGDVVAQKLVKYYEKDYRKIYFLNPSIIEYLHECSNLRDIIAVYSMLAQTDQHKTDVPSYMTDIDQEKSDSFLASITKKIIGIYLMIVKWATITKQQASLLKDTYNEMFYYKVHIIRKKHSIKVKVNIYNKNIDDYIDEHPDLTDEQKEILKLAASTDYQWDNWDSSEYDAVAYQGNGYSGGYYVSPNGNSNVYYINTKDLYNDGYGKKQIPQGRQSFVDQVAQVAIANYNKSGILPSVVVAQACYESDWGESNYAQMKKNIFGIKAGGSFKDFSSWADCMDYYFSKRLILAHRYDSARFCDSPYKTLQALIAGGYCQGDGSYEANCYSIIQTYGFEYFDKIAKGEIEAVNVNVMNAMNFCQDMVNKHASYSQARRYAYGNSGGKEYVFDCSSFMWYAYQQCGINISGTETPGDSRLEYAYLKSHGCEISKTELMPGDLIFYKHNNSSVINHVDMYAGNGMKYNDGSSVTGATFSKFSFTDAVGYMRPSKLLKNSNKASKEAMVDEDSCLLLSEIYHKRKESMRYCA